MKLEAKNALLHREVDRQGAELQCRNDLLKDSQKQKTKIERLNFKLQDDHHKAGQELQALRPLHDTSNAQHTQETARFQQEVSTLRAELEAARTAIILQQDKGAGSTIPTARSVRELQDNLAESEAENIRLRKEADALDLKVCELQAQLQIIESEKEAKLIEAEEARIAEMVALERAEVERKYRDAQQTLKRRREEEEAKAKGPQRFDGEPNQFVYPQ